MASPAINRIIRAKSYVGPGDIVPGAAAWYGLRAYSKAKCRTRICNVVRASDSATKDIFTLGDGRIDVATLQGFLSGTTGKIVTLYDQIGTYDVTQATDGNRPTVILNGLGTFPTGAFTPAQQLASAGTFTGFAQQWTMSMVAMRTGNFTSAGGVLGVGGCIIGFNASTNNVNMFAGSNALAPATDSVFHAVQAVANGASSILYVDGTSNTVNANTGAISSATTVLVGANGFGSNLTGQLAEVGVWPVGFTVGDQSRMNANQHTFWGF